MYRKHLVPGPSCNLVLRFLGLGPESTWSWIHLVPGPRPICIPVPYLDLVLSGPGPDAFRRDDPRRAGICWGTTTSQPRRAHVV